MSEEMEKNVQEGLADYCWYLTNQGIAAGCESVFGTSDMDEMNEKSKAGQAEIAVIGSIDDSKVVADIIVIDLISGDYAFCYVYFKGIVPTLSNMVTGTVALDKLPDEVRYDKETLVNGIAYRVKHDFEKSLEEEIPGGRQKLDDTMPDSKLS